MVGDPSAHASHHGVRGLDHVGGGQGMGQFSSHAKSSNREQLPQPFKRPVSGVRLLSLELLGMRFAFLDVGVPFERLGHCPAGLRHFGLGKTLGNIANPVNPAC